MTAVTLVEPLFIISTDMLNAMRHGAA